MATETEAKYRIDAHNPIRERLRALGAVFIERVLETNHILDRPDGSLRDRGCGVRVRIAAPLTKASAPPEPQASACANKGQPESQAEWNPPAGGACANARRRSTLTFKGPLRPGPFKSREEIETEVDDGETLVDMLHRLCYTTVLWYEKRRESWRYSDCRVELDEPPHIGLFVEIEGPDEKTIRAVQRDLALRDGDLVKQSYVHLLMSYCREHGVADGRLALPV